MSNQWDGIIRASSLKDSAAKGRHDLADRARAYDWPAVFELLAHPYWDLVNVTRPDGRSWYAPLHQAAHGGAPTDVVERLIGVGAWRLLRTARGERPVDIARRLGHTHLVDLLEPPRVLDVPPDELRQIQEHFHEVIRGRMREFRIQEQLRFPELEVLPEVDGREMWFAVPGMYGGFAFSWEGSGGDGHLVASSWCRVAGGSGQRHEVTARGARLVEEGFV